MASIIKVNPDDGALLRSTYFGGDEDEMVTAVTEDAANNIYLAGATTSSDGDYNDCNSVLTGFPMCDAGIISKRRTVVARMGLS